MISPPLTDTVCVVTGEQRATILQVTSNREKWKEVEWDMNMTGVENNSFLSPPRRKT
jgi:hypothetical protein